MRTWQRVLGGWAGRSPLVAFGAWVLASLGGAGPRPDVAVGRMFLQLGDTAAAAAPSKSGDELVRPGLLSAVSQVVPGQELEIGIDLTIEPGWHIYWPGINDSGFPPSIEWTLPEGWTVGAVRWPAPKRHVSAGGILDHVYEDRATLLATVRVPADAPKGGTVTIGAALKWLVCKEACVPGKGAAQLRLRVGEQELPAFDERHVRGRLEAVARRVPGPAPADEARLRVEREGRTVRLRFEGAFQVAFYPREDSREFEGLLESGAAIGQALELTLAADSETPWRGVFEVWLPGEEASRVYAVGEGTGGAGGAGGG